MNIRDVTKEVDEALAAVSHLTGLHWLDLSHTDISNAGLAHLAPLAELRYLYLVGCEKLTDAGLHGIRKRPRCSFS